MHICGKKLRVILHRASLPGRTLASFPGFPRARRKTGRSLGTRLDVRNYYINAVRTASYTGHVHGDMVPFIVSVPSELDFEAAGGSVVYTLLLASRALSRCEHDMALFHDYTQKSAHHPHWRLVRCSAHERSFARLRYIQ